MARKGKDQKMITKEMLSCMPITQAMLEANKVASLDEADSYITKLINNHMSDMIGAAFMILSMY